MVLSESDLNMDADAETDIQSVYSDKSLLSPHSLNLGIASGAGSGESGGRVGHADRAGIHPTPAFVPVASNSMKSGSTPGVYLFFEERACIYTVRIGIVLWMPNL